jgi:hypothetical protein
MMIILKSPIKYLLSQEILTRNIYQLVILQSIKLLEEEDLEKYFLLRKRMMENCLP